MCHNMCAVKLGSIVEHLPSVVTFAPAALIRRALWLPCKKNVWSGYVVDKLSCNVLYWCAAQCSGLAHPPDLCANADYWQYMGKNLDMQFRLHQHAAHPAHPIQ